MATKHTAGAVTRVEVDYDCRGCGFAGTAMVHGEGIGTSTSFVVLDRGDAAQAARAEAEAEARHHATVTAALMPCPRCHRRSMAAATQFVAMTAVGVAALLGGAVAARWLFGGAVEGWILVVWLVGSAVSVVARKRRHFRQVPLLVEAVRPRAAALPRAVVVEGGARLPAGPTSSSPSPLGVAPADDGPPPADGGPRLLR
jgi:hypothetical protein